MHRDLPVESPRRRPTACGETIAAIQGVIPVADADLIIDCRRCGNTFFDVPEDFDVLAEPFGPMTCTQCGLAVTRADYEAALVKMVAKTAGETFKKGE